MPPSVEKYAGPGEEDECGSAEVGNPAGEKYSRRSAPSRNSRIDPYVIDSHQDHRGAADEIDRADPGLRRSAYRSRRGTGRNTHGSAPERGSTSWTRSRKRVRCLGRLRLRILSSAELVDFRCRLGRRRDTITRSGKPGHAHGRGKSLPSSVKPFSGTPDTNSPAESAETASRRMLESMHTKCFLT